MLCFRCGSYNQDGTAQCTVCGQVFAEEGSGAEPSSRNTAAHRSPGPYARGDKVANRYVVKALIGQGGVGAVYRVTDEETESDVALKVISKNLLQTDDERRQFSKSIRAARKLHHPNIVRIHDEGQHEERRYFTMNLLEGLTLRKIIKLRHGKGQSFTVEELVPIMHQLAAGLDYAHKTTWHGDLKPENIIILPDLLKITDFNLIKGLPLKPFLGVAKTKSKGFPYLAPELRVESSNIDGRCDVYSLGVILCELLTGLVYEGHFSRAVTAALERLPSRVDGLVRRALAEHPDGRFKRVRDFATSLEAALKDLEGHSLPAPTDGSAPVDEKKRPPPPPAETFAGGKDGELTTEDPGIAGAAPPPGEDGSLEEIGASQVVLLDTGTREAIADSRAVPVNHDFLDGPTQADPDGSSAPSFKERRDDLKAEDLIETLYSDNDESLIPPPLPDDEDADVSASFDSLPAGVLAVSGDSDTSGLSDRAIPPPYELDDDESIEGDPEDDDGKFRIHDELTALKKEVGERAADRDHAAAVSDETSIPDTEQDASAQPFGASLLAGSSLVDDSGEGEPTKGERGPLNRAGPTELPPDLPEDSLEETAPRKRPDPTPRPGTGPSRPAHGGVLDARPIREQEPTERTLRPVKPPAPPRRSAAGVFIAVGALMVGVVFAGFWAYRTYFSPMDEVALGPGAQRIGPAGGALELDGVVAMVPGTALRDERVLRLVRSDDPIPDGYVAYSPMYRFAPSDVVFEQPVKVTIPFVGDADKAGMFWSHDGTTWERLEATITGENITTHVRHFSLAFVGAKAEDLVVAHRPDAGVEHKPDAAVLDEEALAQQRADEEAAAEEKRRAEEEERLAREREEEERKERDRKVALKSDRRKADKETDAEKEAREAAARRREEREAEARAERERKAEEKARKAEERKERDREERERKEREREAKKADEERKRKEKEEAEQKAKEKAAQEAKVAMAADKKCPPGMVKIKAGSFTFGSSPSDPMRNFGEKLAASASTDTYCIDYYEYPNSKKRVPTTGVTFSTAKSLCEKRGKRLCTEKEWERACKGAKNRRFPYGNRYDANRCNTNDAEGNARELGAAQDFKKCRSPYNIFMMAGNAEEWTGDAFRQGASSKVVKGGAADRADFASRCAARRGVSPRSSSKTLGFRCCADPK